MKGKLVLIVLLLSLLLSISCKENKDTSEVKKIPLIESKIDSIPKETEALKSTTDLILDQLTKDKLDLIAKLKGSESQNQNELYETYKTQREKLIDELNSAEGRLLEKYVNFYNEKSGQIVLPDSVKKKEKVFKKASIEFWEIGEGYTELRNEPYYYCTLFKNKLTSDYQEFIEIEAKENTVLYSADAGIAISFKDVSQRVLNWEKFLIKYPKSTLFDAAKANYNYYVMDYLFGEDNTPTIEISDNTIYPENKTEFERYIKENPNSIATPLVQFLLDHIGKAKTTEDLRKLLDTELSKKFKK